MTIMIDLIYIYIKSIVYKIYHYMTIMIDLIYGWIWVNFTYISWDLALRCLLLILSSFILKFCFRDSKTISWARWSPCINISIVLYCVVLLYCIVLHCIVLYCIVLYCIVLYCIVLYCIVLYCIALHCIVLYNLPWKDLFPLIFFWNLPMPPPLQGQLSFLVQNWASYLS